MMADVGAEDPEDYVFGDVGGVVGDALEIAGDEKGVERLLRALRLFVHAADEDDEGFVAHAVDDVIHFEHGLGEFGFAFDKGFEGAANHGTDGGGHTADVIEPTRHSSEKGR